jgi:hypothetical protein
LSIAKVEALKGMEHVSKLHQGPLSEFAIFEHLDMQTPCKMFNEFLTDMLDEMVSRIITRSLVMGYQVPYVHVGKNAPGVHFGRMGQFGASPVHEVG